MTQALFEHKGIRAYLREEHGIAVTRKTLWVWSRRDDDPFPIDRELFERRQRVVALRASVDAWVHRNLAPEP